MYTSKVTSQGTITIPAALRRKYGLKPGARIGISEDGRMLFDAVKERLKIRGENKAVAKRRRRRYRQGEGFSIAVKERHGKT